MPAAPPRPRGGTRRRIAGVLLAAAAALLAPGIAVAADPVDEFHPPPGTQGSFGDAGALILGPDDALWFPMSGGTGNHIGRIAADGTFSEFKVDARTSGDTRMAIGSDGAIWFTQWAGNDFNRLGRIEAGGASTFLDLPSGTQPLGIASGPDGALWIAANLSGDVLEVEPGSRTLTRHTLAAGAGRPISVAADPGGNGVWVATDAAHLIQLDGAGRQIQDINSGNVAWEMVAGPDRRLWLSFGTENNPVGRLEADGTVTRFAAGGFAFGLAFDTLGQLWIASRGPGESAIQRLDPASGALTAVDIPSVNGNPTAVALGPDDQIWFLEGRFAADPANPNVGRETIGRALTGAPIVDPSAADIAIIFPGPFELKYTPEAIAMSFGTTLLLGLFLYFPTHLFNSTLSSNVLESRKLFGLGRLRSNRASLRWPALAFATVTRRLGRTPIGAGLYLVLLGAIFSLRERATGEHSQLAALASTTLVLAITFGAGKAAGTWYVRRERGGGTRFQAAYWTILIAAASVIISRVAGTEPGFIVGMVGVAVYTVTLTPRDKGIMTQRNALFLLAVGLVAWFVRVPFQTTDLQPDAATLQVNRVLVGVFVASVETTVFTLVPLRFLDGDDLRRWSFPNWAALFGTALFLFAHVVLWPQSDYVPDLESEALLAVIAIVAVYNAVAMAYWAYFSIVLPRRRAKGSGPGGPKPPAAVPPAEPTAPAHR